jgi:hypothetical protein
VHLFLAVGVWTAAVLFTVTLGQAVKSPETQDKFASPSVG